MLAGMRLRTVLNYRESLLIAGLTASVGCASASGGSGPGSPDPGLDDPIERGGEIVRAGSDRVGVLVMAHGGSEAWNATVEEAVRPLAAEVPTTIAYGMADPETLATGLAELTAAGADRIAVVRLFISGESFLHQTDYLLGLRDDPPRWFAGHASGGDAAPAGPPPRLEIAGEIEIVRSGLVDGPEIGGILRERVRDLTTNPEAAAVLLIGHGMPSESSNDALLARMEALADSVRVAAPYREVRVETLREDWAEKRAPAEARIRAWVSGIAASGATAIVVPFRLSGFGPYAKVLDGLDYVAAGIGLLPHPIVSAWLRGRAADAFCDRGWSETLGECGQGDVAGGEIVLPDHP